MGMVVRTNTMALNAYRQLGMNNSAVAKSLEKLSSGFRINRAADDAAGLAISEKMKAQIKGLETASANAQDGISLIQTAEGNLAEVHNMLNRMVELATKSANGTYSLTERTALQDEVDALLDEVNRISKSANFNGINLLDGSMGLNGDTFELAGPTAAADGASISLTGALGAKGSADVHLNTAGVAQQGAKFSVDLADFQLDMTNATADATVAITVAGKTINATIASGTAGNKKAWTAEEVVDQIFSKATNWAQGTGAPADNATTKHLVVDGAVYAVTKDGTKLNFEYAGDTANAGAAAATDAITDAMLGINAKLGSGITVAVTGAGTTSNSDSYHGVLDIQKAVKEVKGERAGIKLDLTQMADLFKDGSQLTIDGTTFTFKMDANSNYSGNVIDLSNLKGAGATPTTAEYAAEAAKQMSNMETKSFVISDVGTGAIHIDQSVADYDEGANAPYTEYEKLTAIFSAQTASTPAGNKLNVKGTIKDGDSLTIGGKTYTFSKDGTGTNDKVNYVKVGANSAESLTNLQTALKDNGVKADVTADSITVYGEKVAGGGLTLQIGDTAADFNKMTVAVNDMSASGLGIDSLDIKTANSASNAIDTIKSAINTVSSTRAGMGALQNRLEYTINNLDVAVENLSAANSRIRDTDMAKEMMNYTKMNVLVQSAQAMLAQANQQPQSVLQLLQ